MFGEREGAAVTATAMAMATMLEVLLGGLVGDGLEDGQGGRAEGGSWVSLAGGWPTVGLRRRQNGLEKAGLDKARSRAVDVQLG